MLKIRAIAGGLIVLAAATAQARADSMQFGDRNLLGTGTYPSDPTAGATLEGLAPGAVTLATNSYTHAVPTAPAPGTYPGTDQIYTSGVITGKADGYSQSPSAFAGPQAITMDYSKLVPAGQQVDTLTLGVAADDFQQSIFHTPYTATVNGVVNTALSNELNALNLSGPTTQFFTVGIDKSVLTPSNVLSLSIDRAGPGGDGWGVDFTTVGVTTSPQAVPEPGTLSVLGLGLVGLVVCARRRPRVAA